MVPTLLILTFITLFLIATTSSGSSNAMHAQHPLSSSSESSLNHHYILSALPNYFEQSLSTTDPSTYDPVHNDFGLVNRSYHTEPPSASTAITGTNWQRFAAHLSSLNAAAPTNVRYHLLYLTRHGQGFHNLAESYYGTAAWDCYYSALNGDPESSITWADARLSRLGKKQAESFSKFLAKQVGEQHMPAPERWFVSPLDRACETSVLMYGTGSVFEHATERGPLKAVVKEGLREENGIHTCDRRSKRSEIVKRWPDFVIEEGFTEDDELWDKDVRETKQAHTFRVLRMFDDILQDAPTYLSMTAHGGAINAILRAVRHREFQVGTGSGIPVLIKAERVEGVRQDPGHAKGKGIPKCVDDPLKAGKPGFESFEQYVRQSESRVEP